MSDAAVFLRPDVIVEPLVDRFYAWLHTVAPVQAAMNLAYAQVPLLESYLQAPAVHVAASRNPAMKGGLFVGIEEERSGEVRELLDAITRERAGMLRFAEAVTEAAGLVAEGATGFSLGPLYGQLPAGLSGLAELVYDTANQPSVRFIEPLAYRSEVYTEDRQTLRLFRDTGAERPFILSTPRLPEPDVLELRLPFRHPGLVTLLRSRQYGSTLGELRDALRLDDGQAAALSGLLAGEPDLAPDRHIDGGGRIRYFGHACLLLQTPEAAILTDPWVSTDAAAPGRYTYRDLPDHIDLAIITHGHQDHVVLETLLQLRGRVGAVVVPRASRGSLADPSLALYLEHAGLPVIEVDDFTEVTVPGGTVIATPFLGEHADLDIRAKQTYCVRLAGRTVYVGADSSGIDPGLYRHVRRHTGPVDLAFLGMECAGAPLTWLYQALLTTPVTRKMSDSRTLSGSNAEQASAIVIELGAAEAYVYAMGEEAWLNHVMATNYTGDSYQIQQIEAFMTWCAEHSVKAGHLFGQHEWR